MKKIFNISFTPFRAFLACLLCLLIIAYIISCAIRGGDFAVYLTAASILSKGENIYLPHILPGLQYFYSPLFAMLLIPFAKIPFVVMELIWLFFNVFLIYRVWKIIRFYLDLPLPEKRVNMWFIIALGLTMRFLLYNFGMVQVTIFLMYASLEAVYLIQQNKKMGGSALLALAINIKILPVIFIPYLLFRNEIRASLYTVLFWVAFLFIPALILGYEYNNFLLRQWWGAINPNKPDHVIEAMSGTHSLVALIPVLLTDTVGDYPFKRNFVNLSYEQVQLILRTAQIFLAAFTLYFLRSLPFRNSDSRAHTLWEISYLFLVTPLIFPHQQKYSFFYLFPAFAYILYFLIVHYENEFKVISKGKFRMIISFLVVIFILTTLTTDGVIGRYYCDITQHFRLITYGALLLIIPLAMCKPRLMSGIQK
jgi:hypothetical protein